MENLVDFDALKVVEVSGVKFREPSLEQYLHFYKTIIKNPKRVEKRKKDKEKIRMIRDNL